MKFEQVDDLSSRSAREESDPGTCQGQAGHASFPGQVEPFSVVAATFVDFLHRHVALLKPRA